VFASSSLLFLVQPVVARTMLPAFGGSASVWTTCTLFFQAVLLLGYLYAHALTRWFDGRTQAAIHVGLLLCSVLLLRPEAKVSSDHAGSNPLAGILLLLPATIGLPYLLLSTTGPLVQYWYAHAVPGSPPYRLFALSNAASLAALLSYPFVFERILTLQTQITVWKWAYLLYALLASGAAFLTRRNLSRPRAPQLSHATPMRRKALWLLLAFCPAVLWLAVANHLSQSVAAIPFLWVVPLAIYLLTFVLCFDSDAWYRPRVFRWLLPPAWVGMAFGLAADTLALDFRVLIAIFTVSLFVVCMLCHGELARRKPDPQELTGFYLWVALGGALGSVFVGLIAPVVFVQYLELPLAVILSALLGLVLVYGLRSKGLVMRLAGTCAAAFVFAVWFNPASAQNHFESRNFYGSLRVLDEGNGESSVRALYNGAILHGVQWMSPQRRRETTAYYAPESGVGRVLTTRSSTPIRVGAIGLGVGTIAAYARPGDEYRFYEINPLVVRIAQTEFRYLPECAGTVDVREGDGRLTLEAEPPHGFDVLVLDAFSGDSIPVHLLTREAFAAYWRHLKPHGVLAAHVTNKYVDLGPLIASTARDFGKRAVLVRSSGDPARRVSAAVWAIVGTEGPAFEAAAARGNTLPAQGRPWTDDFNNLFQVLN
jgi:hypothetical protein